MKTRWLSAGLAVAWLALGSWGCASATAPTPEARTAPETRPATPEPVTPEPPPEPSPEPAPEPEPTGAYGPRTVVIDEPEAQPDERPTLAEAARKARESRVRKSGEPLAVITDENLPRYATGSLSVVDEEPTTAVADPPTDDPAAAEERGEEYWRNRIRDARIRWRDLVEEIERTEIEAAELRQRFYDEDDGFYRDSQIKPAWDRALDRLAELRDRVGLARENVETILLEGRHSGALPGWLREGIEYEPTAEEPENDLDIHEATEPKVIEPDDGGGRR